MTSLLFTLTLLIVILTGCSKKVEYTNIIPANAYIVGSMDLRAIVEKSGVMTESEVAKQKILDILKQGISTDAFQQVEKILKSPRESGLDLEARIYMFTATDFPYPVWVCKISDEKKLETTLNLMAKEQFCSSIIKANGYSYTTIDQTKIIAYNETSVLMTAVYNPSEIENMEGKISQLMKQSAANSINNNAGFEKMVKLRGDINFLASLAAIPEIYSQQLQSTLSIPHIELKDIMALGKLDFEKGKIALKFEYFTTNKEIEKLLKQQAEATKPLKDQFLKYFPESTIAFASVGANGKAMYSLILDNKDLRDIMPAANSALAKEVFDSFDGDISIGITDLSMVQSSPFTAYAAVSNTNVLKAIYENKDSFLSNGETLTITGDNDYVFTTQGLKVYYGIKGNTMYATNDQATLKNICNDINPSIVQAPYAKNMKDKNFFLVLNINRILDLPMVKMIIGLGGDEYKMYYNLVSKIDYFEMSNSVENISEMDLILKDKETNSLKQIVDFARQFIGL